MTIRVLPGLCSVTLRALPVGEVIDLAARAGLAGIEWGGDVHVPPGDIAAAGRVAALSSEAGLTCPSYGSYLQPDASDDDIESVCRTASTLGATNVRVWTPVGEASAGTSDARRAEIAAGLAHVASLAANHGLSVGIEFHGWTLTDTAASAVSLVEAAEAENLFTYWQPIYWDSTLLDDPDGQVAEFDLLTRHLAHMHVYWWRGLDRFPLATGELAVQPALRRATIDGRWSGRDRYAFLEFVENDDPEALMRDAATLRSWLGAEPA
jgi:sugar phosphate isomerase/epimerase